MRSAKSVGRTVGVLFLLHLAAGLTVPFILLQPLRISRILETAAGIPNQVRAAALLLLVGSAMPIGVASAAWSVFRRYSSAMALWLLALAVASFSLWASGSAGILLMLSLSQEYAKAGVAKAELFQALAMVVGAAWKWLHYIALIVSVSWMFLLYGLLYRFRLVPRALAAFGAVATVVQITGVSLRPIWGYTPEMRSGWPLGLAAYGLAVWLMVKGFEERHRPLGAEAHDGEVSA